MSLRDSLARNERIPCVVSGCNKPRLRLSSCCARHHNPLKVYGHPEGRHIPAKLWAAEFKEVSDLIDSNADQPAVSAALSLLKQWTERACGGGGQPAARAFQRFYDYGVPLLTVLKTAAAVWLFSYRYPHILPNDVRLDRAVAIACIRLVPRDKQVTLRGIRKYRKHDAASRRELGTEMREYLAPFFVNIKAAADQQWHAKNQALSGLRIPLTTP